MTEPNKQIALIKEELTQVLFALNGINEYNFEEKMDVVNSKLIALKNRKETMLNDFERTDLENFNPELDLIIKEINIKFDNIIDEKTTEKDKVGQELQIKQNEKKLVNYKR